MDQDRVRGTLNQLFYPLLSAPDLSDSTAAYLVERMVDGRFFAASVIDFAEAVEATVRAGVLPAGTADFSSRYDETQLLEFVRRVHEQLEARRR